MELKKVKLIDIIKPQISMRSEIDQEGINELATSIMEVGLINPLTLQVKGKKYEIIAGHRRYQALNQLQFTEIDANVIEVNENIMFQIRMDENLNRKAVSEIDEAIYIEAIQNKMDLTQSEIASRLGKSASYVNERLAILQYEPNLLNALKSGDITFSVARELNRCKDRTAMAQFLRYAIVGGCTPAIARRMVRDWESELAERIDRPTEPETAVFANELIHRTISGECSSCGAVVDSMQLSAFWLCLECKIIFQKTAL